MTDPAATERAKLAADLVDLLKQATEERSHYYVASIVRRCIALLSADANAREDERRLIVANIDAVRRDWKADDEMLKVYACDYLLRRISNNEHRPAESDTRISNLSDTILKLRNEATQLKDALAEARTEIGIVASVPVIENVEKNSLGWLKARARAWMARNAPADQGGKP